MGNWPPRGQMLGHTRPSRRVPEGHDVQVLRVALEVVDPEQAIGWFEPAMNKRYVVVTSAVDVSIPHRLEDLVEAARSGRTVWAHLELGLRRFEPSPWRLHRRER